MTNETQEKVGYTLWAVFGRPVDGGSAATDAASLAAAIDALASTGVTLRGIYDVSGLRADADVMLWLTGDDAQRLQAALRSLRRAAPLAGADPALERSRRAPRRGVHARPRAVVHARAPAEAMGHRLPVRPQPRLVHPPRGGAPRHARRARPDGPRLPAGAAQHGRRVRPRRLRVDPRARSGRPDRTSST